MSTVDVQRRLLTLDEVAERLGVSRRTVERKVAQRQLPALQLGGARTPIRVDAQELEDWLNLYPKGPREAADQRTAQASGARLRRSSSGARTATTRLRRSVRSKGLADDGVRRTFIVRTNAIVTSSVKPHYGGEMKVTRSSTGPRPVRAQDGACSNRTRERKGRARALPQMAKKPIRQLPIKAGAE